jgi:peptidoglycan/xylan/chitin deacetylase (PgdA/CDA1 family)
VTWTAFDTLCVNSIKVLAVRLFLSVAVAQGWPQPVAGDSASGGPEVLFTFDDGPNPRTTPAVLDLLAAHHIKAIFFMTADHFERDNPAAQALMDRIVREGHVIANHTVNHVDLCAVTPEVAAWEIDAARIALERASHMPVPWFRTPYGAWCPRVVEQLDARRIHNFFWEIDPQEWRTGSAKKTIKRVLWSLARVRGRSVLLMHDTKPATVYALPKILDWLATQPQIHVVQAPDYAREVLGEDVVAEARALLDDAEAGLARGLASALP